ncbi:ATP-binding protein [Coleofasciculus sp. FACHB-SPT9]|uniref:AAA family ATPase n=1 Tax=Cyanophyceae TaxID=3028117 RepID=UPI001689168E|nr:ATP-binding protein [Coleofasciculus sp. FACHB-SPT9]MBD1890527.1 ATP-binding protein [Coleofasciculus sp. FACHB-SPT9]
MVRSQLVTQTPVEVLAPQLDLTARLAKTAEIKELFRTAFVPTDRASEYFRWLDELRFLKQCGRVIGPRDVGKSRASIHYRQEDRKRVSYTVAWAESSSKRLFTQILKDINHVAANGKGEDVRPRLAGSLELFGIELVIVDNAHNLQREALLDLKQLFDESGVPIVLVGEQELDSKLHGFDLLTCFPTLFGFERLNEEDFRKTLRTVELDILALPEASCLTEGTMFEILASSTEARIGVLMRILSRAAFRSLKKGFVKVDKGILGKIANRDGMRYVPLQPRNDSE